ncbi:transcriptional regulator family: Fungal Specific TF [Penicillium roqueforti]|nr:transcriptional regulator family: Fungal Specific TF [Penicillium roqueforti]KAI3151192.1 transcriptional regulator family: Fungal Specific TF [Penicillium roqueforti]
MNRLDAIEPQWPTGSSLCEGTTSDNENHSRVIVFNAQRGKSWNPLKLVAIGSISIALWVAIRARDLVQPQDIDPLNFAARTTRVLSEIPLIDGHNDLPFLVRLQLNNQIYGDNLPFDQGLASHTDLKRMKQGKVGGQFWSVFVECPRILHLDDPNHSVRDTLEQIDVAKRLIAEYSELQYCDTAACARQAFKSKRISSMLGAEGLHQIGSSLAVIRQMYELGVRYITLTHNCDNAFATAASTVTETGKDNGLSDFGRAAIREMNRLGMMIDLSHTSHRTMRDAIAATRAPVIFSHSACYALAKRLRNTPDDVLRMLRQNGGLIMIFFANKFIRPDNPDKASLEDVVDHIFHAASIAGWDHVGIGSDFDGTPAVASGIEDVSAYPRLIEAVMRRGATDEQVRKLVGLNILRVWGQNEIVSAQIQKNKNIDSADKGNAPASRPPPPSSSLPRVRVVNMSGRSKSTRAQRPPRVASCEPCRLSKLACDHRQPCARCVGRDIPHECVYRKNAFKRSRPSFTPQSPGMQHQLAFNSTSILEAIQPTLPPNTHPNTGYQGSSSLDSLLGNVREQTMLFGDLEAASTLLPVGRDDEGPAYSTRFMNNASTVEGAQLLETLTSSKINNTVMHFFSDWKGNGLESHVGAILIQPFADAVIEEIVTLQHSKNFRSDLLALSQRLFENSSRPVEIHRLMTLQGLIDQYTGPNLRWETMGAILTLVGIAATEFRAPYALYRTEPERQTLRMNLIQFGNKCAIFCEALEVLNDVHILFLYQTFQVQSVFYGDQSLKTWRRLNDAACALLAAGLHESIQEARDVPFFLVELRKRIFSRLYSIDISLATFLGRPPRMSKKFCCINLPLDIDEKCYSLSETALSRELEDIDHAGWNSQGHIRPSAVMRWSTITAMIREETLELLLGRNIYDMQRRIIDLHHELNKAWENLPSFLRVPSHELWDIQRPRMEMECLHMTRILYLQSSFLIEWAAWRHGLEHSSLFRSAMELISSVNDALVRREQLPNLGFISLAWRVASCALPAAGALALYLLQPSSRCRFKELDPPSRRRVIENLSVLIVHMDILHSPSDGNFKLFSQAKRSLQSVVDMLLQPVNPLGMETSPTQLNAEMPTADWMVPDYCAFDGDFWANFPDCLYTEENSDTALPILHSLSMNMELSLDEKEGGFMPKSPRELTSPGELTSTTLIKPQARDAYDPNITFEEYHYYSKKTREEEELLEPPVLNIRQLLSGKKTEEGPITTLTEKDFSTRERRLAITDEEWTNASRSLRSASWGACFYLITTDILGPYGAGFAMGTLGWGPGIAFYTVFGFMAGYSGYLLWRVFLGVDSYEFPAKNYGDLGFRTLGRYGRHLTNVSQAISLLLLVGQVTIGFGENISQVSQFRLCYVVCPVIFACVGFFVSQIRTLKAYGWIANLAVWMNLFVIFMTMGVMSMSPPNYKISTLGSAGSAVDRATITPDSEGNYPPIMHYNNIPTDGLIGSVNGMLSGVLAYAGAQLFVEFMAEMRRPRDFLKAMWGAQFFIYSVYLTHGCVVYHLQGQYSFSPSYQGISVYSWQTVGNMVSLLSALICAGLYGNIGVKIVYNNVLMDIFGMPPLNTRVGKIVYASLVPIWWTIAFIIAAAVPDYFGFVSIISASMLLNLTFTIPPLFALAFDIQKNAIRPEIGEGFNPTTGEVIRTESTTARWVRGFFSGGTFQVATNVWHIVFCLASLSMCGLGMWAAIVGMVDAFQLPQLNSFSCVSPLNLNA